MCAWAGPPWQARRFPWLASCACASRSLRFGTQGQCKATGARRLAGCAQEYNDRLFTGLLVLSLAAVVLFRFAFKIQLLEAAGWVAFVFLEVTLSLVCYVSCCHI